MTGLETRRQKLEARKMKSEFAESGAQRTYRRPEPQEVCRSYGVGDFVLLLCPSAYALG
jgi:hypothetical protein